MKTKQNRFHRFLSVTLKRNHSCVSKQITLTVAKQIKFVSSLISPRFPSPPFTPSWFIFSLYHVPIASTSGTVVGRPPSMEVCNLFFLNFLFNLISILIYNLNDNSIVSYTIPIPFWFWLMILWKISFWFVSFDSIQLLIQFGFICSHLQLV